MINTPYISRTKILMGNFLLWALLCGFSLLQAYGFSRSSNEAVNWVFRMSYTVPFYFTYWALSYGVYKFYERVNETPWPKIIYWLIGGGVIFSVVHLFISSGVMTCLFIVFESPDYLGKGFGEALLVSLAWDYPLMTNSFLVYWLMVIIIFALDFYRKYKNQYIQNLELESELTQSQLQALKMQLRPHFLFNALNTISMMVRRKKDEQAVEMISGLSDLLRTTLTKDADHFVTLHEELELIRKYLAIEQIRFKDNIKIVYEIDAESERASVPNLILQPIIENAIKHGLSKTMGEGIIKVTSKIEHDQLRLSVFNTSPYLSLSGEQEASSNGIGLTNTRKRLKRLYGDDFKLNIEYKEPIGVLLEIIFPATPLPIK